MFSKEPGYCYCRVAKTVRYNYIGKVLKTLYFEQTFPLLFTGVLTLSHHICRFITSRHFKIFNDSNSGRAQNCVGVFKQLMQILYLRLKYNSQTNKKNHASLLHNMTKFYAFLSVNKTRCYIIRSILLFVVCKINKRFYYKCAIKPNNVFLEVKVRVFLILYIRDSPKYNSLSFVS